MNHTETALNRREVLRLLALSTALPCFPAHWLETLREVHAGPPTTARLRILTPQQNATVGAIAELIIPHTDTPGAKDARVDEFIDHILADWYSDEDRAHFLAGLADVDVRAQKLCARNFVDASLEQQSEILRALGEELAEAAVALASGPRGYRGSPPEPQHNFYLMFRQLTLVGYFTSEPGFIEQLQLEIIPGRFDGCVPLVPQRPSKGL